MNFLEVSDLVTLPSDILLKKQKQKNKTKQKTMSHLQVIWENSIYVTYCLIAGDFLIFKWNIF